VLKLFPKRSGNDLQKCDQIVVQKDGRRYSLLPINNEQKTNFLTLERGSEIFTSLQKKARLDDSCSAAAIGHDLQEADGFRIMPLPAGASTDQTSYQESRLQKKGKLVHFND